MKYSLLFIAFFAAFSMLSAQGVDFAPVGAKWYYAERTYAPPRTFPHMIEVVGKEMHHGKLCSKFAGMVPGSLPAPYYVYSQNDTVFFYSNLSSQFEMLYDFTAEVGDSWIIGGLDAGGDMAPVASDTITVDSISEIEISGTTLKVWHISNSIWFDWGDRIIETVGNDWLFVPKFGLYDIWIVGLRCYESPSAEYHFVPYPCDTVIMTSGTNALSLPSPIQVSPNPFQSQLAVAVLSAEVFSSALVLTTVETKEGSSLQVRGGIFRLYDQMGRMVREERLTFDITEIETGGLPPGMYFWEVRAMGEVVKAGKCVKLAK